MPEPEFWSSKEVCRFLAVPLSTLRYWSWQRTAPRSYRIGRRLMYKPADVRAWAERRANEPAESTAVRSR
jgi:predicted DNA-binding transcriptional regulator AlpA